MKEQLTNEEIRDFCQRMAMFLHGGIDVGEGLALLAEEEESSPLGCVFADMVKGADMGKPLSACVAESGVFPSYVAGMLKAGEKTGRSEEALEAVADYFHSRFVMERRLTTALLHPAVLMLIMMAVVVILLTKVLPVFDQVYGQLEAGWRELPAVFWRWDGYWRGACLCFALLRELQPFFCFCFHRGKNSERVLRRSGKNASEAKAYSARQAVWRRCRFCLWQWEVAFRWRKRSSLRRNCRRMFPQ